MTTFTPTKVSGPRQWEGTYGVNEDFTLVLDGIEKPAILTQKQGSAPPAAGAPIELELEPHPRFEDKLKAKRPRTATGFGGFRPEDPARAKRIVRQHSQSVAVELYLGLVAQGVIEAPSSASDALPKVKVLTDAFERDAMGDGS